MINKTKPNTRKERAAITKSKIYNTSYQLFKEHGFDNVSVDSIVKAAGVSKGSFYVHFKSKVSLGATLIHDFVDKVDLDYKSYIASVSTGKTSSEILKLLVGKISNVIADTLGYEIMKTLYSANLTKAIITDTTTSYERQLYKMFFEILESGIKKGDFRGDINAETLSKHCILALRGITYEWCIRYPDFNFKEQALEHFEILLRGIQTIQ